MTPKIIELKQAPVVLVELPEGFSRLRIESIIGMYRMDYLVYDLPSDAHNSVKLPHSVKLPPAVEHEILGILSDLTEEQFSEWAVDNGNGDYRNHIGVWGGFETAKESSYSLLESENVYTENPLGDKAPAAIVMVGGMELLDVNGRIAKENRRRLENGKKPNGAPSIQAGQWYF